MSSLTTGPGDPHIPIAFRNTLGQSAVAYLVGLTAHPSQRTKITFTLLDFGDYRTLHAIPSARGYAVELPEANMYQAEYRAVRIGLVHWLADPAHHAELADWAEHFATQPNLTTAIRLLRGHAALIAHAVGRLAPHTDVALAILNAGFAGTQDELTTLVEAAVAPTPASHQH